MEVFVERDFGRREWEARKSISAGIRGEPGKTVQASKRGRELKYMFDEMD